MQPSKGSTPDMLSVSLSKMSLKERSNPAKLTELSRGSTQDGLTKAFSRMTTGELIKKRRSQKRRRRLNTSKKWKRTMN